MKELKDHLLNLWKLELLGIDYIQSFGSKTFCQWHGLVIPKLNGMAIGKHKIFAATVNIFNQKNHVNKNHTKTIISDILIREQLTNSYSSRRNRTINGTFVESDVTRLTDLFIVSVCIKNKVI